MAAGPVSRILSGRDCSRRTVIPLGHALLRGSSDLPGGCDAPSRHVPRANPRLPPYLVLLRVGFALPAALLRRRCALTAPFHPYLGLAAGAVCFLWHFPSTGLEPGLPDVIRHTALRSSDFPSVLRRATSPVQLPTEPLYRTSASDLRPRPPLDLRPRDLTGRAISPHRRAESIYPAWKLLNLDPIESFTIRVDCPIRMIRYALEILGALGTIASMAYSALCLWSAVKFIRQRHDAGEGRARLAQGRFALHNLSCRFRS